MVEVVVNGQVVASKRLPADGNTHEVSFEVAIAQSSWCEETIHQLWRMRQKNIAASEQAAALQTFDETIHEFRRRGREAKGP